jgi:hypothetical protein
LPEELPQSVAAEFLASPAYERHLRRLRQSLRSAREDYADLIDSHFPTVTRLIVPEGSMLLWLQLPEGASGDRLFAQALGRGIKIAPGSMFTAGRRMSGINLSMILGLKSFIEDLGTTVSEVLRLRQGDPAAKSRILQEIWLGPWISADTTPIESQATARRLISPRTSTSTETRAGRKTPSGPCELMSVNGD